MVQLLHPRRTVSLIAIRRVLSIVLLGLVLLTAGGPISFPFGSVQVGVTVAYAQDEGDPAPTRTYGPPVPTSAATPSTSATPTTTPAATDDGEEDDSDDDGNFLTRMAGNAANSALAKLTESVMAATVTAATWAMSVWMKYDFARFYGGPAGIESTTKGVINIVWQITAVVFVISLIVSGLKLAASRRIGVDDGLEQVGVNIFRYLAYMVFVPVAVPLGMIASDAIANEIMTQFANCSQSLPENPEGLGQAQQCIVAYASFDDSSDLFKKPAMLFLSLIIAIVSVFGSAAQFVALLIRTFMLPIAAGLMPLFAAGAFSEMGKNGLNKLIGYVVAGVIFKPVSALLYTVVIWVTASSSRESTLDIVVTMCMMAMVGFTAPSLVKLIAPTEAAGGSSGSGMMAAGGAAMGAAAGAASGKSGAGGHAQGSSAQPVGADPQQTAQTTAHLAQATARAAAGDYAGAAQHAMQGLGSMGKSSQGSGGSGGGSGTPGAGPGDGPGGDGSGGDTPSGDSNNAWTGATGRPDTSRAARSGSSTPPVFRAGGDSGGSGDTGSAPESGTPQNETRAMLAKAGEKMSAAGSAAGGAMKGAWKTARHPVQSAKQSAKRAGAATAAAAKDPVRTARAAYGHAKQAYQSRPAQFARSAAVAGFKGVSAAVKTGLDETDKAISGYSTPVSHNSYSGRIGR